MRLFFARYVTAGGRLVPDVLEPWDGTARGTEKANQPVLVQVEVPYGTRPGTYGGSLTVTEDGRPTNVPLRVKVFPVTLPHPGTRIGNILTSFHLSPESYVSKSAQLYGFKTQEQRIASNRSLFGLLGEYRVSPGSWGFAEPRAPVGYESSPKWWLDSAGNFVGQLASTPGFSAMRIPISSNRTSARNYIAGLTPYAPEKWCDYLREVRSFWEKHRALRAESVPYLFGFDEPGLEGQRLVARQAAVVHRCFPGGRQLMTGNPTPANAFLWDGRGGDDLDIWTVLSRRYYGKWTSPALARAGGTRSRDYSRTIDRVRARGRWCGRTRTPARRERPVSPPPSRSRTRACSCSGARSRACRASSTRRARTSYTKDNPFETIGTGEKVLLYPGAFGPLPSARLEQIRDGIEDWAIFNMVRQRRGADDVRAILGNAGLFSATRAGVRLGCTLNCELRSKTKFAWPLWSRDATTPSRIEAAKLAALSRAR